MTTHIGKQNNENRNNNKMRPPFKNGGLSFQYTRGTRREYFISNVFCIRDDYNKIFKIYKHQHNNQTRQIPLCIQVGIYFFKCHSPADPNCLYLTFDHRTMFVITKNPNDFRNSFISYIQYKNKNLVHFNITDFNEAKKRIRR